MGVQRSGIWWAPISLYHPRNARNSLKNDATELESDGRNQTSIRWKFSFSWVLSRFGGA